MRFSRPSILLASVLQATQVALAFHITRSEAVYPNLLARDINSTSGLYLNLTAGAYYINITLGGTQFSVSIDTGSAHLSLPLVQNNASSDLWVAGPVPNANSTGVNASIHYDVGSDEGPVQTADLTLLGYTIPDQAFLAVTPSSGKPEGFGIIGLGPSVGSRVLTALGNSAGDPPIDRIFQQNTSYRISSSFSVLLDPDGVIGPDGNAINTTSNAPAAPSHNPDQLLMVFDTGDSLPQLPENVVNAIYSGAKGAKLVNITSLNGVVWVVDCDVELNISFKIGGITYPIHPLDVTQPLTDDGKTICFGTFQSVIPGAEDPTLDGLLGDTFLSNVYLLMNYGDFIDGSTPNSSDPYVQILSTTDPAQAHADFVAARLSGLSRVVRDRARRISSTESISLRWLQSFCVSCDSSDRCTSLREPCRCNMSRDTTLGCHTTVPTGRGFIDVFLSL
ncbi:aspartic peptidase domain-containing protein [Russula aff. rugulosa BPL654]|nr:aspartic peptidase domain-containing protein [Russula aff. rugulosa BPL654]